MVKGEKAKKTVKEIEREKKNDNGMETMIKKKKINSSNNSNIHNTTTTQDDTKTKTRIPQRRSKRGR